MTIGATIGFIFFAIILGSFTMLLISLFGRLSNTTYKIRGSGAVIKPFRTPTEKRKEVEDNNVSSEIYNDRKELEDIVYKYQEYPEMRSIIAHQILTMNHLQIQKILEAIGRTAFLKNKGLITNPYYETTVKQILRDLYYKR